MLTQEEHFDIHWEQGDLGACALLSDGIDRVAPTVPVVAFDLEGYRFKRFDSVVEAQDFVWNLGVRSRAVQYCCVYKQKSVAGYQWFYESEVGDIDYIGPVVQKRTHDGNDTSRKGVLDTETGIFYNSKREALRATMPYRSPNSVGYVCEPRFI